MRLALVSQNCSPGLLVFRKDLIRYLVDRGHEVYCLAVDYGPETRARIKELGAIPIDYSLSRAGLNPFRDIIDVISLSRKLREISPDIVFGFFVKPSIYGIISAKLAGVPRRVGMLEGLGYLHTPYRSGFILYRFSLKIIHGFLSTIGYFFAHKVLFLNPDDPRDLSKFCFLRKDKIKVIGPIGLDLKDYPFAQITETSPVRFVFIARLLAEKGIYDYLAAARIIKSKYKKVEIIVLGGLDSENPSALSREQLNRVIEEGLIIYPGHVSNVNEWLAKSHVFVLPSYYREGVPRSTQEAMAMGRAVITTDVPGCRETVVDGLNGFLIPPFQPEILAERMQYFIEFPEEIKRMGLESYRIAAERFDVDRINPVLESILVGSDDSR